VYFTPSSSIDANTWFELSAVVTGSPTAKLYEKPITISTVSDTTGDIVIYDENPSAGLISFVAPATAITDVYVTTDNTK